jgi:putative hemolysin
MGVLTAPALGLEHGSGTQHLSVTLAASLQDVKEAQRLRHRVFIEQLGAQLGARLGKLERDRFDPFCKHFIVRDQVTRRVVGTYRILTPDRAAVLGAFMAEREFDLARFAPLRGVLAEVGRACVDAEYRRGSTIMLLWSALAAYARAQRYRFLFGCVSLGLGAEKVDPYAAYEKVVAHLSPPEYRVFPVTPAPHLEAPSEAPVRLPVLLKGYLRAGAWICGEPAWDPEFQTTELLVLLPLEQVEGRYARHFLRDALVTA